jgi:hypothetical protein
MVGVQVRCRQITKRKQQQKGAFLVYAAAPRYFLFAACSCQQ